MQHYIQLIDKINEAFEGFKAIVYKEVAEVQNLENYSLTPQQEAILYFIIRHQPITAQELSVHFSITKSAVSQVVKKLEEEQFIVRKVNPSNRRESIISLGTRGESYAKQLMEIDYVLVEKYYSKVSIDDLQHVLRVLQHLNERKDAK